MAETNSTRTFEVEEKEVENQTLLLKIHCGELDMVVHCLTAFIPLTEWLKKADRYEFKARLVYMVDSRPARAISIETISEKKNYRV